MSELQMVFTSESECQSCINQINTNLGYVPPWKWDDPHKIYNVNCEDYIAGLRYYCLLPTGGRARRGLLANVTEVFNYVELEFNTIWDYQEPEPPPIEP
jgi:hypothetical protein